MSRLTRSLALLACMSVAPTVGSAQTLEERIYAKAKEALQASRNLVAATVVTDMEMIDSSGQSMGTMSLQEKITGWAEGEPVRTIVANSNPQHSSVARSRFKVIVDNHPDKGLKDGTTVERLASEPFDGKRCSVLLVKGMTGKVSFEAKVWVEEATGLPLKVVQRFVGFPMIKSLEHAATYGRSEQGAWVPVRAVVDATVGVLIHLRTVSKYQFTSWVERPPQSKQPIPTSP